MPKISFVMPTKNRVAFMPECVNSLLGQSFGDIEIIIVNDGSDDGTKELLENWDGNGRKIGEIFKNVKVIHNDKSIGAGLSRNRGTIEAEGEIIAVCDDDDIYMLDRAACIDDFFNKFPSGHMMTAPYVHIGFNNELIEQFDGEDFDNDRFLNGKEVYFCHPAAAYTKAEFLEIGGYKPENKRHTDDWQFVNDWISAGKKITLFPGKYLCGHRIMPKSIMASMRGFDPSWNNKKKEL